MAKKRSKNKPQFLSSVTAGALAVVLTFFIVTSVVYLLQKTYLKSAEEEHKNEMIVLEKQISDIKKENVENEIKNAKKTENVKIEVAPTPDVEYRFEKCGVLGAFVYEDWYSKVKENLEKLNLTPKDASSACHSTKGNMVVLIAQTGKECEGPKIYKFNTATNTFGQAKVDNKSASCLSPLDVFGIRNKYVINVTGKRTAGNCEYSDSFEYNYGKNTVELKKISYKCDEDTTWKSTVY